MEPSLADGLQRRLAAVSESWATAADEIPARGISPAWIYRDREDRPGPHPESDDIAPTDAPLLPDEEAGMNLSPWVWGPALVLVLAILVYLFS